MIQATGYKPHSGLDRTTRIALQPGGIKPMDRKPNTHNGVSLLGVDRTTFCGITSALHGLGVHRSAVLIIT